MKINIKAKDFSDKEKLEKTLSNRLKKPLGFLTTQVGQSLPFYYEVEYFESGAGFLAIGESKELHRIFKTQRVKGKGEEGKVDKKKVALGKVSLNQEGVYEFLVEGGLMKKMQAKTVIKSINMLKKHIGDKFLILNTAPVENLADNAEEEASEQAQKEQQEAQPKEEQQGAQDQDNSNKDVLPQKLEAQLSKIQANLEKLQKFIGKQPQKKLLANLEKFSSALDKWKDEFQDNPTALKEIEKVYSLLQETVEKVEKAPAKAGKPLSEEQHKKVEQNLQELHKHVGKIMKELESIANS